VQQNIFYNPQLPHPSRPMLYEGCYFIMFEYASVKKDRPAGFYFI